MPRKKSADMRVRREKNMKVNLSKKAELRELDYIEAMRKCMNENNKTWYTNTYEFTTGERFKIEIQRIDPEDTE